MTNTFLSNDLVDFLSSITFTPKRMWDSQTHDMVPVPGTFTASLDPFDLLGTNFRDALVNYVLKRFPDPEALYKSLLETDTSLHVCKVVRYDTGGGMEEHVDSSYPGLHTRCILLAPNHGKYSYTGGDLIVNGAPQQASTTPGEWVVITVRPGQLHSVSPVMSGTRISIVYDVCIPLILKNIVFLPIHGKPTDEVYLLPEAEEEYRQAEQEFEEAAETLRIAKYDDAFPDGDCGPLTPNDIPEDATTIAVVLYGYYEDGVYSLDNLEYCDAHFIKGIGLDKWTWASQNTRVSCVTKNDSYRSWDVSEESVLEGHVLGYDGDYCREDESRHSVVTLKSVLKSVASTIFFNTFEDTLGRQKMETTTRYNDEYNTYFKSYDVTILILKRI